MIFYLRITAKVFQALLSSIRPWISTGKYVWSCFKKFCLGTPRAMSIKFKKVWEKLPRCNISNSLLFWIYRSKNTVLVIETWGTFTFHNNFLWEWLVPSENVFKESLEAFPGVLLEILSENLLGISIEILSEIFLVFP